MRGAAAALVAAVAALAAAPDPARAHVYTYTVSSRGDVRADLGHFRNVAYWTLINDRTWTLDGHNEFRRVASGGDFNLVLASPAAVDAASPVCSPTWSCRVGRDVLINDVRWRETTPTWPLDRVAYRHYVLNHEVGHWVGLGHLDFCGKSDRAAVMLQQSKGLGGCRANVWPLHREKLILGRQQHWPVPIPRWFWRWLKWYLGHEEYTTVRSPATRPDAAPRRIPQWTWQFLLWYLHRGPYEDEPPRSPETRPEGAPARIPQWTWEFMQWRLGTPEYTTRRSPATRPAAAPDRVPHWAWVRYSVFRAGRKS